MFLKFLIVAEILNFKIEQLYLAPSLDWEFGMDGALDMSYLLY